MLRKISLAAATAAVAFGLGAGLSPASVQAQTVLKYTHFQPGGMDQPKHAAAMAFKSYVEAATGGSIEVEIYPAGQLGNAQTVMEGMQLGTVEMAVVHDGGIPGVYPPFMVFGLPFVFESQATAWEVLDGPFGQEFGEAMREETGIRLLGYADNGVRHFTNSVRPIRTPADMEGLKIRVQPSPVFINLVESLGASASAIDWAELPAALAQGTVDGQENGVTNIIAASLHQHQEHVSLNGHVYSLHAYLISDAFYESLSDGEKLAVQRGAKIAEGIHRGMTAAQDSNAASILGDLGMTVTALTPAEIGAFRDLAQPAVREYLESEIGPEWVEKLLAAVEEAESN